MALGTVKFFNVAKGFGFITSDDDGKDVFVPVATLKSAGVASLKAGQRVTYNAKPDGKGLKAVDLKVIADAPAFKVAAKPSASSVRLMAPAKLTIYLDPEFSDCDDVVEAVRAAGHEPHIVNYIAAAPSKEELQRIASLLRDNDQSLVRKYASLFLELCLDDRFIGDAEYWTAIHEHPVLINGPVLASPTKASICRSTHDVQVFLGAMEVKVTSKPKGSPESLRRLLAGNVELPAAASNKVIADVGWKPETTDQTKLQPTVAKAKATNA